MPTVNLIDPDLEASGEALESVARAMADLVRRGPEVLAGEGQAEGAGGPAEFGRSPVLVVFAGPNGSGKTTMAQVMLQHGWLQGFEYINPDNIARDRFGDWNDPGAVLQAARYAAKTRSRCLKERRSLAIETVFSTTRSASFVREARDAGFFVRRVFIGTDGPAINVRRVARRVRCGGHDVPVAKIVARHPRSTANLAEALAWVERVAVFDNSVDEAPPALQFRAAAGAVARVHATGHEWADRMIEV